MPSSLTTNFGEPNWQHRFNETYSPSGLGPTSYQRMQSPDSGFGEFADLLGSGEHDIFHGGSDTMSKLIGTGLEIGTGSVFGSLFGAAGAAGEAGGGGAGGMAGTGATEGGGTTFASGPGTVDASGSSGSSSSVMDWVNRGRQGAGLAQKLGGSVGSNNNSSRGGQQQIFGGNGNGVSDDMSTSIWSKINLPQDSGKRSIDQISRRTPPTAFGVAENLASKGRYGDTNLLHVSDDELNQLDSTGKLTKNPNTGLPEAFNLGDMLGGGSQVFGGLLGGGLGNRASGDIQGAGNRGVQIGAPLENVQRQPYQQQLQGLMNNPQDFLKTDPYIQASQKAIGDQYQANFAKSGNLPFSSIQGSAAMQQMMSQAYNDRIRQLTTLGGFDQGPGFGGNIAYQSGRDAAGIGNNARTGGINQIFGGLGGMMGGSGSGVGGLFSGFGNLFGGGGSGVGAGASSGSGVGSFPTDEFDF